MGSPLVGEVVLSPFPCSDLTASKRRPALVLAEVGLGDVVLCQITSKPYADASAIPLSEQDFQSGNLSRDSFIRVGKLFTANEALIVGVAGTLNRQKIREVITTLVHILEAGLKDAGFQAPD